MTDWRRCDDCNQWTEPIYMDRFDTRGMMAVVCKSCSYKRRFGKEVRNVEASKTIVVKKKLTKKEAKGLKKKDYYSGKEVKAE